MSVQFLKQHKQHHPHNRKYSDDGFVGVKETQTILSATSLS